jgi:copper transport protein
MKRFSMIMVIFTCLLAPTAMTLAHSLEPVAATPAPGAVLDQSPAQVRLVFTEEISENGSALQVFNAQNEQVDLGNGGIDLNDPEHKVLTAGLPELPQGVYRVEWKIVLSDGDDTAGQYSFGIGAVSLPASTGSTSETEPAPETKSNPSTAIVAIFGLLVIIVALIAFLRSRRARSKA